MPFISWVPTVIAPDDRVDCMPFMSWVPTVIAPDARVDCLPHQVGADAAARPWEAVGGVGFDQATKKERAPVYVPPKTRPDLKSSSAEAPTVAEEFNDAAVRAFKEKEYQRSYVSWPLIATDGL